MSNSRSSLAISRGSPSSFDTIVCYPRYGLQPLQFYFLFLFLFSMITYLFCVSLQKIKANFDRFARFALHNSDSKEYYQCATRLFKYKMILCKLCLAMAWDIMFLHIPFSPLRVRHRGCRNLGVIGMARPPVGKILLPPTYLFWLS